MSLHFGSIKFYKISFTVTFLSGFLLYLRGVTFEWYVRVENYFINVTVGILYANLDGIDTTSGLLKLSKEGIYWNTLKSLECIWVKNDHTIAIYFPNIAAAEKACNCENTKCQ